MAVTLAEIAALAGVSRGTVDRALNDRGRVDPKVAARVRRIAAERGYRPNRAGRMLARAKNPIRIGVIVQSVETMFMHTVFEEIERASAHFTTTGAEVLVRPLEGVDAQQQLDVIDELLEAGVQGIALSPAEDERVRARIQELSERMPVVTFNSDLPDSRRLCFVGQNYTQSGRIAAELLSKCVPKNARVLAMAGNLEYDGHRTRLDGFCEHLKKKGFSSSQIEIEETYNDYRLTYNRVTAALQSDNPPAAIYMANRSVTGCVDALKAAGMDQQVRVIAHDMSPRRKQMLLDGSLDLTITQDLFRQGSQPLRLLADLLQKNIQPENSNKGSEISIICAQNIE